MTAPHLRPDELAARGNVPKVLQRVIGWVVMVCG
jgi:hypothetical protein